MNRAQYHATLKSKWIHLIQDCQSSSLTVAAFARQNNIGESNLYVWSKRLGLPLKHKAQPTKPRVVVEPPSAESTSQHNVAFVELKPLRYQGEEDMSPSMTNPLITPAVSVHAEQSGMAASGDPEVFVLHPQPPQTLTEESYLIEMNANHLHIKMRIPWQRIVELTQALA